MKINEIQSTSRRSARRGLYAVLAIAASIQTFGCAAIFRGTSQTVTVVTDPPGRTVYYRGMEVDDGERITIRKEFRTPEFGVDDSRIPLTTPMSYDPDVWLVGDMGWFLLGGIPGIIAFGVDFGTGAWRQLDDRQLVRVPERRQAGRTDEKPERNERSEITSTRGIEP